MAKLNAIFLFLLVLLFTSCTTVMTNLTQPKIPENPSNIYTISLRVNTQNNIIPESIIAEITIDEQTHRMSPSPLGNGYFEYEYRMPKNQTYARYYYTIYYDIQGSDERSPATSGSGGKGFYEVTGSRKRANVRTSVVYNLELTNRYVITLESNRGYVGINIPVVGRGFNKSDEIIIGGVAADTTYYSPNSLSFKVPPLSSAQSYDVFLQSQSGNIFIDQFTVDANEGLIVSPNELVISSANMGRLVIAIPYDAPSTGLVVDVQTDIPASVIMPEAFIDAGERSVNIPIKGGNPGSGSLYISAPGFSEVVIPITITE